MEALQNLSFDVEEMIDTIFSIETYQEYSQKEIDKYESIYKTFVLETLAEYTEANTDDEYEAEELETSVLTQYNADNLVYYFKKGEN